MKKFLPILSAVVVAGSLSAQTTYLSEDFDTAVPPAGWTTINLDGGVSIGWIQDAQLRAWHQDESGYTSDNYLVSPVMDLSLATAAYLHFNGETNFANYMANHPTSLGDGISNMEVTTDGGLTWTVIWTDTSLNSGDTYAPDVDLSAYLGSASVQIGIHYFGTFAQEWWVDNILVDDQPAGPPPPGTTWLPNLPTTFAAAPFGEDFDTNAGTIPTYMALTNIDALSGAVDPEAWCNVGQLAPCIVPNSGAFNLEMGLDPLSLNYHDVRNSMVLGIDGGGNPNLNLDFSVIDFGEEADSADGVWISADGTSWFAVTGNWSSLGAFGAWTSVADVDITATPVDTSGQFYLMFQQDDNFPYNDLDGIGIDDIDVSTGIGSGPAYTIANLVAGQTATFSVSGATPFGQILLGYSLTGAGPTNTQYGVVNMSLPIRVLASLSADANGDAVFSPSVPSGTGGLTLYTQGLDLGSGVLTNSLAPVVQ